MARHDIAMIRMPAIVAALALAACASPVDPSPATVQKERVASWEKLCENRGFVRGTSDFRDCVLGYDKQAYDPPPLK
ncbi:MAG: hypothetical protein U1F54_12530 [Burkholderiales bacterium]